MVEYSSFEHIEMIKGEVKTYRREDDGRLTVNLRTHSVSILILFFFNVNFT